MSIILIHLYYYFVFNITKKTPNLVSSFKFKVEYLVMKKNSLTSIDINQKLSNGYNDFSREVKKAAKYVLNNPAEIPLYSIRTIASNANVNPSTMVRLINLLGFERYAEFKSIYKQAASKLPVSRLQRDLTDSTVLRDHQA